MADTTEKVFVVPWRLPSAPTAYERENEQKFRRILELALGKTSSAVNAAISAPTIPKRRTTRVTVRDLLTPEDVYTGEFVLPGTAGAVLLDIRAYVRLWFRLYASEADKLLDAERDIDTLPPTTPIILDCLFTDPSPEAVEALDDAAFVAGPGCTNPAGGTSQDDYGFAAAFDADDDTCWTAGGWFVGNGQSIGDTFSFDMGSLQEFGSFEMVTFWNTAAYPLTISLETSLDGSAWTMQEASIPCEARTNFTLDTPVTTRYVRLVIVTTNAEEWAIQSFTLFAAPLGQVVIRLFDGDVEGVLAFNWDNPAVNKLYYALKVLDVTELGQLYSETFASYTRECTLRPWFLDPIGGLHIIFGAPETSVDNCDLLHQFQPTQFQHTPWGGAIWEETGGTRPNYYFDHYQLRCNEGNASLARFAIRPDNRSVTGFRFAVHRGGATYDPAAWSVFFYAYLSNASAPGYPWQTKGRLCMGISRSSLGTVLGMIGWWDDDNVFAGLASQGADLAINTTMILTGTIAPEGANVRATLYGDGIELCTALVPQELLDIPNHPHVGILMSTSGVPDAPAAEPDWGLESMVIYGADTGINVDLGYVPIELPGGTLTPVGG